MPKPKTSPDVIDQIKSAPWDEPHDKLAARLGISAPTVRKYRAELRVDRQEATKERIAEHAVTHVTDALADLTELRTLAKTEFKLERKAPLGALWLDAIKLELVASAGQDKVIEFADLTDEQLKEVISGRK